MVDPIALAFGTALVGAIATTTWQQARKAAIGLWRRVYPHDGENLGTELDTLREQVLEARHGGDTRTEKALEEAWQVKLQQLLRADPTLTPDAQRILDSVLTPALTPAEQVRIGNIIMTGSSHDSSTFTQIGNQTNYNQP